MKFRVGDKVKFDSSDWRFYGTVSAVFENTICPCYRVNVQRMEMKHCRLSITQFEFELEATNDETESDGYERKREDTEKRHLIHHEPEKDKLITIQTKEAVKRKISEIWERNLEQYIKGRRNYAIYNWITNNRKQHQAGTLSTEKYEKFKGIHFQFGGAGKKVEKKRKSGDEWEITFESYQKGEKSDTISSWIANNRKEFKTGKLTEEKYEKLMGINFPFDVAPMKDDNWEKLFEEWKKGDRKSVRIQQWKQRSIRQHSEDKLSVDRILKLKEVGILK